MSTLYAATVLEVREAEADISVRVIHPDAMPLQASAPFFFALCQELVGPERALALLGIAPVEPGSPEEWFWSKDEWWRFACEGAIEQVEQIAQEGRHPGGQGPEQATFRVSFTRADWAGALETGQEIETAVYDPLVGSPGPVESELDTYAKIFGAEPVGSDVPWACVDGGYLYYVEETMLRRPLADRDSNAEPVTTEPTCVGGISTPAFDASHVYWAHGAGGTVRAMPRTGGDSIELVAADAKPGRIAVGEDYLYYVSDLARVERVPKNGGPPEALWKKSKYVSKLRIGTCGVVVAAKSKYKGKTVVVLVHIDPATKKATVLTGVRNLGDIALTDDHVYFVDTEARSLARIPVGGGEPLVEYEGLGRSTGVVAGAEGVFFNDAAWRILRVPATGGAPQPVAGTFGVPVFVAEGRLFFSPYGCALWSVPV